MAAKHPDLLVLPAHRFYFKGRWNGLDLSKRVNELLEHHVQRCSAMLEILRTGPKTADELATAHFEERLLEGFGSIMAANEVISHCELLTGSGDVTVVDANRYEATGSSNFENYIRR